MKSVYLELNTTAAEESLEDLTRIRWAPLVTYIILFLLGGPANLYRFITLIVRYPKLSRFNKLVFQLVIADLIVTWIIIPTEIFWRLTNVWYGGDILCRLLQICRALGLYLSSFVLVCISVDRYYAVAHPLESLKTRKRNKVMFISVWTLGLLFSLPQVSNI